LDSSEARRGADLASTIQTESLSHSQGFLNCSGEVVSGQSLTNEGVDDGFGERSLLLSLRISQ
jgi:hypothetical protein